MLPLELNQPVTECCFDLFDSDTRRGQETDLSVISVAELLLIKGEMACTTRKRLDQSRFVQGFDKRENLRFNAGWE
jgi:hypothetical protein